jgi:SAM-dependent methyltransferase
MLNALKTIYLRAQFEPGLLGLLINPFYFARRGLFRAIVALAPRVQGRTLDVGCGQKPYEQHFRSAGYVGLEIDTPENRAGKKADQFYDGMTFPFRDGEFDSVISSQVFEHVFEPDAHLEEVQRVLKPGGLFLLTVPFVWDEHEQPVDFARYTSYGLEHLLGKHGFEVVEQHKTVNDIRAVFQMANCYLYSKTVTRNPYLNILFALMLMAPVTLLGVAISFVLPRNDNLYLDNVILAKKRTDP